MTTNIILPDTFAIANPVTPYSSVNPKWDSLSSRNGWAAPSGQLPAANYVAAVMPMVAVLPRPDVECNPFDYQANAHADELYELPIVIQGGTWIWRFVVNTMPVGATLGLIYGSEDHGKIKWTPTTGQSGPNSFDIYAYGQDGQFLRLQWTVDVNTEHCVFADTAGSDTTGDGSRSSPYQSFEFARSQCTGGQLLRLGSGTFYQTTAFGYVPTACGGLHGNGAGLTKLDMSGVDGATNNINYIGISGFWAGKINFDNLTTAPENPRYFITSGSQGRITQYKNNFTGANNGTLNNDNTSCLFVGNNYGDPRNYIAVVENNYDSFPFGTNGFSAIDGYTTSHVVVDNNTTSGVGGSRYFVWLKGPNCRNWSIRGNEFWNEWTGKLISFYGAWFADYPEMLTPGNFEVAYNKVKSSHYAATTPTRDHSCFDFFSASQTAPTSRAPVWTRRNTYWGFAIGSRRAWDVEFHGDSDVIVNEVSTTWDDKYMIFDANTSQVYDPELEANITYSSQNNELHGNAASGFIDADGVLIGAAAAYKYQRGHQIGGFL